MPDEVKFEQGNGEKLPSKTIKVTDRQAMVCFFFDLGVHMLGGMINQLALVHEEDACKMLGETIEGLVTKRNRWLQDTQRRVVPVTSATLPTQG